MPGKGKQRSSSVPKERGPRAVHKNSPTLQKQEPVQQQQMQKSTLKSMKPASASSSPKLTAAQSARTDSSPCSSRASHRSGGEEHNHADFSSKDVGVEKCRCLICTCGKHHCPPAHRPNSAPFDGTTSYGNTFQGYNSENFPERVVPTATFVGTQAAPGHFDTTHKANYIAPEAAHHEKNFQDKMERSMRPKAGSAPEKFDHTSVQRQDYPWHNSSPTLPVIPTASPLSSGPFYGLTTSQEHYPGWDPNSDAYQRTSPSIRNSSHNPFPDAAMEFGTSYGSNYPAHKLPEKAAPKPKATYSYGSPRCHKSQHQADFDGKQNPMCPVYSLPIRPASSRSGHVKYRMDTTGAWR